MPPSPLKSGDPRRLGRFRLLGRLGEGGQGIVYLGEGTAGERVAVKVLKNADPRARDRLSREMASAMRVAEFLTARVIDAAVDGPSPYIVSEYVDGPSLQERVGERGPLRDGELDRLMLSTARALRAIHRVGIVHRDLKPANILLGPDGPRVVDFGIARAIDAEVPTQMVGTPAYFAPEWLRDEPPTPASDVFAWAGTMVFAATGRPPFGQGSTHALLNRVANAAPDLSGVPGRLRPILERCLSKEPGERPTAAEVDELLLDAQVGGAPERQPPASPEPVPTRREPVQETVPTRHEPVRPPAPRPPAPIENITEPPEPAEPAGRPPARPEPETAGRPPVAPAAETVGEPPAPRPGPAAPRPGGRRRTVLVLGLVAVAVVAAAAVAVVRALSGGAGSEPVVPAGYTGVWTGTVTQTEGINSRTVRATMTMREGERTAALTFTLVACDGRFTLREASDAGLRFELTSGQCPAETLRVWVQQDRLEFHAANGIYTANGDLGRDGG